MSATRRNLRFDKVLDLTVRVGDPQPLPKFPRIKVICTVPANANEAFLLDLLARGMNVMRCNLHTGSVEDHRAVIRLLRDILEQNPEYQCAVMVDLSGDVRLGRIGSHTLQLEAGQDLVLCSDQKHVGDEQMIAICHNPPLSEVVKTGSSLVMNDGISSFTVTSVNSERKTVRVRANGNFRVQEHKLVFVPGVAVPEWGVSFCLNEQVDFMALTISSIQEMRRFRLLLTEASTPRGGSSAPKTVPRLVAKIGSHEALEHIKELISAADAIMVSRGDLGVVLPEQQVFVAQKHIVSLCNASAKPCIMTTQMLHSMIHNPRPTRAEATDVANAVLDGCDCMMLSGETEMGEYPREALEMMVHTCAKAVEAERQMDYFSFHEELFNLSPNPTLTEVIAAYAVRTALTVNAAALLTITETGGTARRVTKYRPPMPVIALTPSLATARSMLIVRNVIPFHVHSVRGTRAVIAVALERAKRIGLVKSGDTVVAVVGDVEGASGSSNTFLVTTVQ